MDRSGVDHTLIVGREAELARLDALADQALGGEGAIVTIEGPAGIGKSALVTEAAARAGDRGYRTLRAVGSVLERDFPFGMVRQMVTPVVNERDRSSTLFTGAARFAEVPLGLATDSADAGALEASTAMHALYWLIAKLTDESPLVLLLDDAQWADTASLRFLVYLARRLEGLPLLILVSLRPGVEHADPAVQSELQGLPWAVALNLEPLTLSQTGHMIRDYGLGDTVHDDFVEACHHVSGGNPFLLTQLLQRLVSEGVQGTAADADLVAAARPQALSRWIVNRLVPLGDDARELASAYAVLGPGASLHRAAVLAELTDEAATLAADALIGAHILGTDRPYDFVHPLVAAAVYDAIPPARRALSHRRAARLHEQNGAPAAIVAAHLLASEPGRDVWAIEMLQRAARDAMASGAPPAAITYLERALAEGADDAQQARLLTELGAAQQHTSLQEALRTMRAALELETDRLRRTEIHLTMGRALFANGAFDQARDLFLAGLEEVGDDPGELGLELSAWSVVDTGRAPSFRAEARPRLDALLRGDAWPETRIERLMLAFFAYRATATGEFPADVVADLARRALGNGALLADCSVDFAPYAAASTALLATTQLAEALAASDSALSASRRSGSRRAVGWFSFTRGSVHLTCGNILEAHADLEEACAASVDVGGQVSPRMAVVLASVLVERGDLVAAREALASVSGGEARPGQRGAVTYWYAVGRLHAAEGDLRSAFQAYLRCEAEAHAVNAENPAAYPPWRAEAATAAIRLGQPARAREIMGDALGRARGFGAAGALGVLLRAEGVVAGGLSGITLLEESVATLEPSGCRLHLARSLLELGSALRRDGHRRDAIATLRRALDLATVCGGAIDAARARDELVDAGARPRRVRTTGPAALTAREMRVATMAAGGSTNSQIAQDLYVTLRTVETHLTSIYRKLDISRRDELPRSLDPTPAIA